MKSYSNTFASELDAAGVASLDFSWNLDGTFNFGGSVTPEQRAIIKRVAAEHNPNKPLIPQQITRFQARAALLRWGFLSAVESYMASPAADPMVALAWREALHFNRDDAKIAFIADVVLALPAATREKTLDDMFIFGETVE